MNAAAAAALPRALIFDVDGTLADTEEAHRLSFNAAFKRHGLDWHWSREQYRALLKTSGGKQRMAVHADTLGLPAREREQLQYRIPVLHAEKTRLYGEAVRDGAVRLRPGIERLLAEARSAGCRLAIATTTTRANVDALLAATLGKAADGLFELMGCAADAQRLKPSPEIYQWVLQRLQLPAADAVAFEDSANGLRAAHGAGLWTVATPTYWSEHDDLGAAELQLPHLGDPGAPLDAEPGGALQRHAWLTLAELGELKAAAPRPRLLVNG